MQLSGVVPIGKAGGRTYQDELVVFSNATESIPSTITPELVKGNCRNKGRMSLTSCDNTLLPGRIDCQEVILTTCLIKG